MQFKSYFTSKTYKQNKMQNPHSATQRFKNHLAYQLGLCMIYFDKDEENNSQNFSYNTKNIIGGGGQNSRNLKKRFCAFNPFRLFQFIYTLLQIIRQHKIQKQIYQQTIAIFPSLKYPTLESCEDYQQSLQIKYHLAYLLGESLIQANNTLLKGSYFKLPKEIKKANEKYKEISYIIKILKEVDFKTY